MSDNEKPTEETRDEPVLEGAAETFNGGEDPRRGSDDPGLIRDLDTQKPTTNPYGSAILP